VQGALSQVIDAGTQRSGGGTSPKDRETVRPAGRSDSEIRGVWRPGELEERPFEGALTHVAALGRGMFALTALSDGFLLDSRFGMLDRHFCYEPCFEEESGGAWCDGWLDPVVPLLQITHGLAYDAATDVLVAQPQSVVEGALDDPWDSYLALYEPRHGTFLGWQELPFGYRSHGLAVVGDEVWMARGSELLRYALPEARAFVPGVVEPATLRGQLDLSLHGVADVRGLALDEARGELLVLDGAARALLALSLEDLR
jgi:hypothetical protein